jgi:hypothetical protein
VTINSAILVNDLLNRVAAETGLAPVADPYADTAQHFLQLRHLLQTAGEELTMAYPWEWQVSSHQITTGAIDTGDYDLPDDFLQMIDQTGWERSENVPLVGPLSAQAWTYLLGRNLVSSAIYASFRIKDGKFSIFPQPPPAGLDINFEYQSTNWISDGQPTPTLTDTLSSGAEIVLFDRTLISRYLKLKWLAAKGFDTTKPQDDFNLVFGSLTSKDKGNQILNAGGGRRGSPYLDYTENNIGNGSPA